MAASQPAAERAVEGEHAEAAEAKGDIDEIEHVGLLLLPDGAEHGAAGIKSRLGNAGTGIKAA